MLRPRNQAPSTREFASVGEFLSTPPASGTFAVAHRGQWLDLRYEDRSSPTTLIVFHSSLPAKITTLPVFSGGDLAKDSGMNYIGVSDPSLTMGDIDLAWFLGNATVGSLPSQLSPLLKHLLGDRNAVLFGASGGGYAAFLYGKYLPNSVVVGANPRLNMIQRPPAKIAEYANICHGASTEPEIAKVRKDYIIEELADLHPDGLPFWFVLLQNQEDWAFLNCQAKPFLAKHDGDPRLTYVQLHNGNGHVPVPRTTLLSHLKQAKQRFADTDVAVTTNSATA